MFAVIATGGKQYRVREGDTLTIEKIDAEVGAEVELPVVMKSDGKGSIETMAADAGVTATATVEDQGKGKKIRVFTYKNKSRQHKRRGHRQLQTTVKINKI